MTKLLAFLFGLILSVPVLAQVCPNDEPVSPFPSLEDVTLGERRVPPVDPPYEMEVRAETGEIAELSFVGFKVSMAWKDGRAPSWWSELWSLEGPFWWITEPDQKYNAYFRGDCNNLVADAGSVWRCDAEYWAFYYDQKIFYRTYRNLNCVGWELQQEQEFTVVVGPMVRRATGRVKPE